MYLSYEIWDAWKTLFFQGVKQNIPLKRVKSQRNAPWFNSELRKLIHKKRRLWKCAKSSGDPDKWSTYKRFSNIVKDQLNKAYQNYVNNLIAEVSTNSKKFWSFVKARTGKSSIANRIEHAGKYAYSHVGKAEMFNTFFSFDV